MIPPTKKQQAAHSVYPVQPKSTWMSEPLAMTLTCSSIFDVPMACVPSGKLMMYCDPPWTQGNLTTFYRKAGIQARDLIDDLTIKIIECADMCDVAFIEHSKKRQELTHLFHRHPKYQFSFDTTYYKRNPCQVHVIGRRSVSPLLGIDEEYLPSACIQNFGHEGDCIIDPCFGQGLTPLAAAAFNKPFWGVELNPYRMAHAIARIQAAFPNAHFKPVTGIGK